MRGHANIIKAAAAAAEAKGGKGPDPQVRHGGVRHMWHVVNRAPWSRGGGRARSILAAGALHALEQPALFTCVTPRIVVVSLS
jgi:hypothetical protein